MNLFLIAWNIRDLDSDGVGREIARFASVHHSLDPATQWSKSLSKGRASLFSISASPEEVAPRRYVHTSAEGTTLFTGLPVDPEDEVPAHQAGALARDFDRVRDRLEGTYAVLRIREHPASLEIQTDLLAGEHVYYRRVGNGWLISNSVLLIERVSGYAPLDPLGISMYLRFSQALGDRTLREGIRLIPAAQRWRWAAESEEPQVTEYYPPATAAADRHVRPDSGFVTSLADEISKPLTTLGRHFSSLVCPLTGGKDSRVVASLLIASETPATYFTYGDPAGEDAVVAKEIARRFELEHVLRPILGCDVIEHWDERVRHCIHAGDGMRSLYLLAGLEKTAPVHTGSRDVYLWGAGGELARAYYGYPPLRRRNPGPEDIEPIIRRAGPVDRDNLILPDTDRRALDWQKRWIREIADDGVDLRDIPDIWGNHVVDGRRIGNNGRALTGTRDTFAPFVSRAWFEATFALAPIRRLSEPLHYELTRHLVPDLHGMPFADSAWRPQNPAWNLALREAANQHARFNRLLRRFTRKFRKGKLQLAHRDSMFSRLDWFEAKRSVIRELALDTPSLELWDHVDRNRFERLMDDRTNQAVRSRSLQLLYIIATLVYYETDAERTVTAARGVCKKTGT